MEINEQKDELCTEDHLIAYIDILGSEEKMKSENSDDFLNTMNKLYELVRNLLDMEIPEEYRKSLNFIKTIKTKMFSDNIVIATDFNFKESDPTINIFKLTTIIGFVAAFQGYALSKRLLTRGGITIGKLYLNDIFIYGKGLIEVYELENKLAIFPRIVTNNVELVLMSRNLNIKSNFIKADDGLYYIDYLNFLTKKSDKKRIFQKIQNEFQNILTEEIKTNQVKQKLDWFINYYNNHCDNNDFEEYKINMTPTLIPASSN